MRSDSFTAQLLFQLPCWAESKGNVRCTAVEGTTRSERSPTFAAQLHLPAHDLFWANLRVQLHLPPLDQAWNPVGRTPTLQGLCTATPRDRLLCSARTPTVSTVRSNRRPTAPARIHPNICQRQGYIGPWSAPDSPVPNRSSRLRGR